VRICRGLRLRSLRLGLADVADVVEFHPPSGGLARPYPIENKRGKPKPGRWDEVQLCAQALCLEEMLSVSVPEGAIFYGQPRRRMEVRFDSSLRVETERLALRLHELQNAAVTPPAVFAPHCKKCSLQEVCLPQKTANTDALSYVHRMVAAIFKEK